MTPPSRSGSGSGSGSRPISISTESSTPASRPSSSPSRTADSSSVQLKFGEHTSRPGSAPLLPPGPDRPTGTVLLAFPASSPSSSRYPPSALGSTRSQPLSAAENMDAGFQTVARKGKGRNTKKENTKQNAPPSLAPVDNASQERSSPSLNGDTASETSLPPAAPDSLSIKPLKRKLSARKIPDTTLVAFPLSIEQALASRSGPLSDLTFGTIPARPTPSTSPTSSSSPSSAAAAATAAASPVPRSQALSSAAARNPSPARAPVTTHPGGPAVTHQLPPKPSVGPMPPVHVAPPTHRAASPAAKNTQLHASGPASVALPPQSNAGPHQPQHMPHGVPSPHYGPQHASATPSPVTSHAPQMHPGSVPPHYQQQQQQQFQHGGSQQQPHHSGGSYGQGGYGNNRGPMQGPPHQHGGYKNQRSGANSRHSGPPQHQYGPPQQQQQQQHYQNQQQQPGPHNAPYQHHQQQQQHQPPNGGMLHVQPPQAQSNQSTPTPTPTSATVPTGVAPMYPGMTMSAAAGRPGGNMPPQGMMMAAAAPGVPQGMPMMIPQYVGPDGQVMMGYYYAMPQMPQPQPAVQGYASSPSQLLAQLKAQQQQQQQHQQPTMYPPPPSSASSVPYGQPQTATGPGASTNRPPPPGQPPMGVASAANPSASSTTVAGMVLPTGVNVPQQQHQQVPVQGQPQHQPPVMPMTTMAAPVAPTSVPPGIMPPPMHMGGGMAPPMGPSTSPPLLPHAQLASHSPITAGSPTPPLPGGATSRPTIRIASKDDPTKTIQLTDLATKATRSHRGSNAGLGDHGSDAGVANDTASMTASSVGGGVATTPDGGPAATSQDGGRGGDGSEIREAQLIAQRQMEENQRRGTKALEIKRPEHPRNGTPSPRPGSSPVVGKPAAVFKAQGPDSFWSVQQPATGSDEPKATKDKSRSRSRSKSPAKAVILEAQGGFIGPVGEVTKRRVIILNRGRAKSPTAIQNNNKPKSPSPSRSTTAPEASVDAPVKVCTPSPAKETKERSPSPVKEVKKERSPSPVKETKERSPSPVKETKERSPSPVKEVKKERSPSPAAKAAKEQERSPSPAPKQVEQSPARSRSPSPVRSGPSSPKTVPTAETPEPVDYLAAVQSSPRARAASPPRVAKPVAANAAAAAESEPERAASPARSTASDLEEGEIRASPTTGEYPAVSQSADADENGVFRYSRSRLTELCLPDLPLPNGINLAVFADLRGGGRSGSSGGYERGPGGLSRGGGASGSSRGGMRPGMPERSMSTPTPYQGAPGSGVSTPTRERRPMPMPPGAAAAAAMAASSSGRSMSGRGESRRDGSRRGTDRDGASGDREKRGSRRGTKRTGTADESASSSSMSLPSHQPQQPQLAVAGAALQPSERAHGARGVEVLPEDLKPLEKSSTAWVPESVLQKVAPGALPTPASADANLSEGEMEVQREAEYCAMIEKQMRGVLNKLTPENMEKLQPRFAESLKYPSALKLIGRLIVRKSFDEPKYASLYASLTLYMYHHVKPLEGMPDDPEGHKAVRSAVRRIIIHECQDQFSRRPKWAHLAKGSISEEQFEEVVKIKSKVLGNMRFVAELFNYNVVSKKVMYSILLEITKEIAEPAEEDLECLIVLITTTSQYLRDSIGKKDIDDLFKTRIVPIAEHADLIPRIKFALMDLINLWRNNFVKPKPPAPSAAQASAAASSVSRQDSREFNRRGDGRGGDSRGDSRYGGQSGGSRYDRGGERSERFDRGGSSSDYRSNDRGNRNDRGPRESRGGYDRGSSGYERSDRGDRSDRYGGGDRSERAGGDRSWSSQQGGARRGGERAGDRSSRYGSNEQESGTRASPEGSHSRSGPARSGTPNNRGGSSSRASTGAGARSAFGGFGALSLLGDGGDEESEDEPPVRKILARPTTQPSSSTPSKRTKSPEPTAEPESTPEITTEEQAVSRIERAMKEFMTNFDYQELADQFKKYSKDVIPAAIGRSIEIITEEKEKQVRIYGQGLATAVKEGIVAAESVMSGIMSSMIMEEYEDMKVDIPQLDTLTKALCEELAKAMDDALVAPLLAKVSSK